MKNNLKHFLETAMKAKRRAAYRKSLFPIGHAQVATRISYISIPSFKIDVSYPQGFPRVPEGHLKHFMPHPKRAGGGM